MGEFSLAHILIVLVVVLLLFGPQKLGKMGGDLGEGIRNFKKGIAEPEPPPRRRKKKKRRRPVVEQLESAPEPIAELEEPAPHHQDA